MSNLLLVWLTIELCRGKLDWSIAVGSLALSGMWLLLTRLEMRHLFKTYCDTLSRLQIRISMGLGALLSFLAFLAAHSNQSLHLLALIEIALWGYIYWLYRRNRARYIKQGHGPLPDRCWVNPDPAVLEPGDLLLTSGPIAGRILESLDHGEVVLRLPDGTLGLLSSYMPKGCVINTVDWFIERLLKRGEHYVVLKLRQPLSPHEVQLATELAYNMRAQNEAWRDKVNEERKQFVSKLPLLSTACKEWLIAKTKSTGYDVIGLFVGRRTSNHWTCIGACLELYRRLGIRTNNYGTGLLGLGTGLFDPIMPVRFLSDRAFCYLTQDDKATFAQMHNQALATTIQSKGEIAT